MTPPQADYLYLYLYLDFPRYKRYERINKSPTQPFFRPPPLAELPFLLNHNFVNFQL